MDHAENHETSLPAADTPTQIDLVCGMTVPADSPRSAEFDGKNYVFCSDGCQQKFENDPVGVLARRVLKETSKEATCCGGDCLLYTSPSPRDATLSRMPSSA